MQNKELNKWLKFPNSCTVGFIDFEKAVVVSCLKKHTELSKCLWLKYEQFWE
jgi:hypothetical protein